MPDKTVARRLPAKVGSTDVHDLNSTMRILVLYGPNLNLLGWVSRGKGTRLTLDKINRRLRREARALEVELKIYQEQSETRASILLQRRRNRIDAILLVPGIWARSGQLLRETLALAGPPLAVFHLEPEGGPWHYSGDSILSDLAVEEAVGAAPDELAALLSRLVERLKP